MFTLKFRTDNAAFHWGEYDRHAKALETARILRDIAGKLERNEYAHPTRKDGITAFDFYGNVVGHGRLTNR